MRKGLIALTLLVNLAFASENVDGNKPVHLSTIDSLPFYSTLAIAVAFVLAIIFLIRVGNKPSRKKSGEQWNDFNRLN